MRSVMAEQNHIINILPPQAQTTAITSDVFSMKDASHVTIIIQAGSTDADAGNITVLECDDFTPSNSTAIAFKYAAETTDSGDTLSSLTAATVAGIDVSANDNIFYVIEIDADELTENYNNLQLAWSIPGGSQVVSAVAILSGLCYQGDQNRTQIA